MAARGSMGDTEEILTVYSAVMSGWGAVGVIGKERENKINSSASATEIA